MSINFDIILYSSYLNSIALRNFNFVSSFQSKRHKSCAPYSPVEHLSPYRQPLAAIAPIGNEDSSSLGHVIFFSREVRSFKKMYICVATLQNETFAVEDYMGECHFPLEGLKIFTI